VRQHLEAHIICLDMEIIQTRNQRHPSVIGTRTHDI
jgi:hypothetical protein